MEGTAAHAISYLDCALDICLSLQMISELLGLLAGSIQFSLHKITLLQKDAQEGNIYGRIAVLVKRIFLVIMLRIGRGSGITKNTTGRQTVSAIHPGTSNALQLSPIKKGAGRGTAITYL